MRHTASLRFFEYLVRLYPRDFRLKFGEEMAKVFYESLCDHLSIQAVSTPHFLLFEYLGLLRWAAIAHWEEWSRNTMGGIMKPVFSKYWNQQSSGRWQSFLASIPYFLFALSHMLPWLLVHNYSLPSYRTLDKLNQFAHGNPITWWALTQVSKPDYWSGIRVFAQFSEWAFTLFILVGLLFAWRARWPQWSTTYIGFALLNLVLLIINLYPDGILIGIGFLVFFALVIIWIARRNLFHALLTALPFATMFFWLINADSITGWEIETYLFIISGFVMTAGLFIGLRSGNPVFTLILMLLVTGAVSTANAYYATYYSNMRFPPEPTPIAVGQSTLYGLIFILLFTAPVWIGAILRWLQTRKA